MFPKSILSILRCVRTIGYIRTTSKHTGLYITHSKHSTFRIYLYEKGKSSYDGSKKEKRYEEKEVPVLIRELIPSITSLKTTFSYSGETVRDIKEHDANLMELFLHSQSINELCRTLALPYHYLTGYSAASALEKLGNLRKGLLFLEGSFVSHATLRELFHAVKGEVHSLNGSALVKLMVCKLCHPDFDDECFNALRAKFLEHLHKKFYSIAELMNYIHLLNKLETTEELADILEQIWVHLCMRHGEILRNQLAEIYSLVTENYSKVFAMLDKSLGKHYLQLDFYEMFLISKAVQTKSGRKQELMLVSKWTRKHEGRITHEQLIELLSNFIESEFVDSLLLTVLSRFIPSEHTSKHLSADVLCSVLTYCTVAKYYDERIMNIACEHYLLDQEGYSHRQLGCILRAVGTLNFIPTMQREFFSKVEKQLLEDFYKIDCLPLLDMIVHLIYVYREPVNLMPFIFAPLFLGNIREMTGEDYEKAVVNLRLIDEAFGILGFNPIINISIDDSVLFQKYDQKQRLFTISEFKLREILNQILGPHMVYRRLRPTLHPNLHEFYLEINMDGKNQTLKRLAVLLQDDNAFCINDKKHMLGPEAANIRMLKEKGFEVILLKKQDVLKMVTRNTLSHFMKSLLVKYGLTLPKDWEEQV